MAIELDDLKAAWLNLKAQVDQLASERQQYLDIFERAGAAYIVTAPDGTIRDANGAAVDVLQRRRRYLQGKPFAALVALERRAQFRDRLRALRAGTGEPSWSTVIESPGLRSEVRVTARPIGMAGEPRGFCWRVDAL